MKRIVPILALVVLLILLASRLQLGLVRYFDADEFAYLHWAHNVYAGQVPFRDFFQFVMPGFLYILAPLYAFAGGTDILTASRIFAFVAFAGMTAGVMTLYWVMLKSRWAIGAGLLLAFLPLPADKFLEVRPDNLATVIALFALIAQVRWFKEKSGKYAFRAGVLYGLSFFIMQKTLPQIAVAGLVSLGWVLWGTGGSRKERMGTFVTYLLGLTIPVLLFFAWIISISRGWGTIETIMYSLTKLPFEVNRLGDLYYMQPDLFFYPNAVIYGRDGWHIGLLANHFIWMTGLVWGSIRLLTPFVYGGRKGMWSELLVAGTFLMYSVSYLYWYPMRHTQYLIPVAVFVVYYATDALRLLSERLYRMQWGRTAGVALGILGLYVIYALSDFVQMPKFALSNAADTYRLEQALATILPGSYVFDMTGATVYFRDPYYVSAVPFGELEQFLSRPFPGLAAALEKTETQYIYRDLLGRLNHLSYEDREYITGLFEPAGTWGLLVRTSETK